MLCHGDLISASILRRALDEFSMSSGLYPNMAKSTAFYSNVPNDVKEDIHLAMPFREGDLPVRYLGVPLTSKMLSIADCRVLVEKGVMERGFLDYNDKKKKEGGAKEDDGAIPILGDLAKRVKNIEGNTTMPKGILKKDVCNVSSDTHEVVMPLNDVGSGTKVNFEAVGKSNANYTTDIRSLGSDPMDLVTNEELCGDVATNIDKPSSSSSAQRTMGSEQERELKIVDCVLPKAAAAKVKSRYENSIVGFFVGKDPSFPVVQQYVSNTWRKFRFEKITRNDDGVYLFKFASKSGMDQVLEKGPWMIRKSPIILNKWSPSVSLKKGEVTKVPVWVKLYNVPVLAYSEDGLSLIATQIGKPIMLDAFTSSMCVESWGRISFARALIEISAHSVLKKEVTMAISDDEGDGYTKEVIRVVYEWKPPHCVNCQSFGYDPNLCPKLVHEKIPKTSAMDVKANTMEENDDGFVEVKSRKKKKGADSRSFGGLRLNKPNSKVIWQQKKGVDAKGGSNSASPSVSTNDNEKGEEMGDSGQQPKVSEHVGTESLNVNKKKAQEPSSSKSAINDVHKDKNVSSSPALKTWDCINESDTDDEDVIPSYGSSLGGGNQLEDNDFDFSDGYEDQVVDFSGQLKEFRDFKLSMCGFCVFVALLCRTNSSSGIASVSWKEVCRPKSQGGLGLKSLRVVNCALMVKHLWYIASRKESLWVKWLNIYRLISNHIITSCGFDLNAKVADLIRDRKIMTNGWSISVSSFWMYKVVKRIKGLKKPLRKLLYDKGNLHENVKKLRHELDEVQKSLDGDPSNLLLREEEAAYLKAFQDALIEEERFLFQKAKVEWLKLGDANTAYFHKVVKSQAARNRIDSITNMDGTLFDGDQVPIAFINHYTDFIGQSGTTSHVDLSDLFCNRLSNEDALSMIDEVSDKEIREAMFSLGDNKAPGPDGYSAAFFKEAWSIISVDVCKAIKEFFTNGILL
ncbi:hypothetical protein Tco_0676605, partial [Tanacetum coccineum]